MTTIRIDGMDDLQKRLDNLVKMKKVNASIAQAALFLAGKVKHYPPVSRRPNPMLKGNSARAKRMRAGFFARLHAGEIDVPYMRNSSQNSERLSHSWTLRTENQGFRAIIGTGVSYARLVQDEAKQTAYHKQTGWVTVQDVTRKWQDEAIRKVEQALQVEVNNG
jgi:hypothetical protein